MCRSIITTAALLAFAGAAFAQAPAAAPTGPLVFAYDKNVTLGTTALWMEEGKVKAARGPDIATKAPADATKINVKVLALGGPNFRRVFFPKGAKFSPPGGGPTMDAIFYVIKGRMKVTVGNDLESGEVGPGDAFRELAGTLTKFEILEDIEGVETSVPPPTPPAPKP
ncbi:MAG: hypothetical protein FJX59_09450 [Alphaproteobacteria bacterium]|nr:hypothetical protein [Alphaproteobacteria bacterium]